jgi:hypothetical protein
MCCSRDRQHRIAFVEGARRGKAAAAQPSLRNGLGSTYEMMTRQTTDQPSNHGNGYVSQN